MILLVLFVASLTSTIVLLLLCRDRPRDRAEWNALLTGEARRLIGALELRVRADQAKAQDALLRATVARSERNLGRAVALVDLLANIFTATVEDRTSRLKGMGLFLRMASAVATVPALSPAQLRLVSTRTAATLSMFLHHVLLSAMEQLANRIMLLRLGYFLVLRAMLRSCDRVGVDPNGSAWKGCAAGVYDLGVLDPALVEAFTALLASVEEHA